MPPRAAGRPKASHPRDVKVTIRLTEQEADSLQRLARDRSLSATVRECVQQIISMLYQGEEHLRDTHRALIRRELRKARKAHTPEAEALMQHFTLEEPGGG